MEAPMAAPMHSASGWSSSWHQELYDKSDTKAHIAVKGCIEMIGSDLEDV